MKLIFLDIDGTLTEPGSNKPPDSAVSAIEKARARGHKVFLCTGRNPDMLKPLLRYHFDGFISCGGGYVAVGEKYDDVLYDKPMPNDERDLALKILHDNGVFCTIEAFGGSWCDENIGEFLNTQGEGQGNSELERWRKAINDNLGIKPMKEYNGSPVYKIVIMCREISQLDEAKKVLSDYNFVVQDMAAFNCINGEIINKAFNKGLGVQIICKKFSVPVSETIGFGDSMNDLEMIQTVGTSVCMSNGSEALKELSDIVCPSVRDGGLAKAFLDLGLI